jgi:hypothetical protein
MERGILFAHEVGTDFYYIGFSANPEERIEILSQGNPRELKSVKFVVLTNEFVKEIREDFLTHIENNKVKETWYQLNDYDVYHVSKLMDFYKQKVEEFIFN